MAFTSGNDINILQTTDSAVVSAGSGGDTYVLAPGLLSAGQDVRITDGQGINTLKLVGGLDIVASKVASNTAQLTLSNDAVITLNDVSSYQFNVGGTALTGGVEKDYATFTQEVLGVDPPVSGTVTGGGATIHADGSVSTTQPESGPESLTLAEALALETLPERYTLAEDDTVNAGDLTVANAQAKLDNATTLINGAVNADALDVDRLFHWDVQDSAEAILTAIDSNEPAHVADADTVQVTNDDVSQDVLDALTALPNFEQGDVTVTPDPDPESSDLSLSFPDAWNVGQNDVSFDLTFPAEAQLESVSLQGGGSIATSASISTIGGVTIATYSIAAGNGKDTGTLNLPFHFDGLPSDDFAVTVGGLTINGQPQAETTYTYQNGSLVEQEPESTPGADVTPPELLGLDIPDAIKLSEEGRTPLTLSAEAEDDLSGIDDIWISFDQDFSVSYSESGSTSSRSFFNLSNWEDGVTEQESTKWLLPTNGEMQLNVDRVEVSDRQGNDRTYQADDLADMGINTKTTLTGGAEKDVTPPELLGLDIPDAIELSEEGRTPLTLSAEAKDDLSGIDDVSVWFDQDISYSGSESSNSIGQYSFFGLFSWDDSATAQDSTSTRWLLPTNGEMQLNVDRVEVSDRQGNDRTYQADDLADMGINTKTTLTGGAEKDVTPPELLGLDIPDAIELSEEGRTPLTLSAEAKDDLSGIDDVSVWFDQDISYSGSESSNSIDQYSFFGLLSWDDSATAQDSTSTRWLLPTNGEMQLNVDRVEVSDRQGNENTYDAEELMGLGVNTTIDIA